MKPGVEVNDKDTQPLIWSVAGVPREAAYVVSRVNDRPAYGGTPADQAVISAIQDLKARGFAVTFYPFISMDVATDNALPNPYSATRPAALSVAGPDHLHARTRSAGSVDQTGACATQVAAFVGEAAPVDFTTVGESVLYAGPAEWSFRRFIVHYAHLCEAAGGVDGFLIGSEMRGATTLRSDASSFPFVDALVDLAGDVRSVLSPGIKITYGADWTEHGGYQPQDGTGDVYFHLDPLWASTRSMRSASTSIGRYRIGATARLISTIRPASGRSTTSTISAATFGAGRSSTGTIRLPASRATSPRRSASRKSGWPSPTAPTASRGSTSPRRCWSGGRISITTGPPESNPQRPQRGCRNRSRSGSPNRLPGGGQGLQPANVFIDPKKPRSFAPYFSRRVRDDLIQRRYVLAR